MGVEDWECEKRGADVDTGEEDGRGHAEDLSGTDCVVHCEEDLAKAGSDLQ